MSDIAHRSSANPILRPADVKPSIDGLKVECLLNPGAFRYQNRIGLLLRVAERPPPEAGFVSTPLLDPNAPGGMRVLTIAADDPALKQTESRLFSYRGETYLTTLSHLRLAWSEDGTHFAVDKTPTLIGTGAHESFGVEDCRVTGIGGTFYLTYTAVSPLGVAVGMCSTRDWQTFEHHGLVLPCHNKDCALFPEKIGGKYFMLHRPSAVDGIGGNYIWIARSPDLLHWGDHRCLATTRPGSWESARIGAGAAPIRTDAGWLEIYHAADAHHRYCLGALLLDLNDPCKVLARSREPIMTPSADYEQTGFFGNVVFTNGHLVSGDTVTVYYGASDEVICRADFSIKEILASL